MSTDPKPKKSTDPKPKKSTDPKPKKSTDPKPKKSTDPKPEVAATAAPAAPIIMRCKVLKNGLRAGGGVSAAGKILNLPQNIAELHESRGEVKILGTK